MENMNGPTGIVTPLIVGILRIIPISTDKITDIIPVDYTANALICVMWDTVNRCVKRKNDISTYTVIIIKLTIIVIIIFRYQDSKLNLEPKIFNYVSSVESPITWGEFSNEIFDRYHEAPPQRSMWYSFFICAVNFWILNILRLFLHWIPATFVDLYLILRGKNPK